MSQAISSFADDFTHSSMVQKTRALTVDIDCLFDSENNQILYLAKLEWLLKYNAGEISLNGLSERIKGYCDLSMNLPAFDGWDFDDLLLVDFNHIAHGWIMELDSMCFELLKKKQS